MGPKRKDDTRETGDRSRVSPADLPADSAEEYTDYRPQRSAGERPAEEPDASREADLQPGPDAPDAQPEDAEKERTERTPGAGTPADV